jgi:hypothetical protein
MALRMFIRLGTPAPLAELNQVGETGWTVSVCRAVTSRRTEMAKGSSCPNCGEQTFHKDRGAGACSKCGADGWIGAPYPPGGGKGRTCGACGELMLRQIATRPSGDEVLHCYHCQSTVIVAPV